MSDTPLTPEQIKHWRGVLLRMLGPYALIMPEADIQEMRTKFQEMVDADIELTDEVNDGSY